jgi:hypothetical protein
MLQNLYKSRKRQRNLGLYAKERKLVILNMTKCMYTRPSLQDDVLAHFLALYKYLEFFSCSYICLLHVNIIITIYSIAPSMYEECFRGEVIPAANCNSYKKICSL